MFVFRIVLCTIAAIKQLLFLFFYYFVFTMFAIAIAVNVLVVVAFIESRNHLMFADKTLRLFFYFKLNRLQILLLVVQQRLATINTNIIFVAFLVLAFAV